MISRKMFLFSLVAFSAMFFGGLSRVSADGYATCKELCSVVYGGNVSGLQDCNSSCAQAHNSCKSGESCKTENGQDGVCGLGDDGFQMVCFSKIGGAGSFSPVSVVPASPMAPMGQGTIFKNPLAFDTVEGFLSHFLTVLQQIIVTLSLVFIVVGAVMYIISAGNSDMIGKAKGAITASLIGLALGIAAPSFLKEISFVLGWGPTGSQEVDDALTLTQIVLNVLNFLLAAVGILSILMMVLGGAMYLTSAGNEDRIQSGKNIAKNAIIGIIISLSAMVLVRQIAVFFMS